MARFLELLREPEAIFWVFGFPVLLAPGLGIAFRNKPADVTSVAVVAGPGAQEALTTLAALVPRLLDSWGRDRRNNRRCKASAWENTIW